MCNKVKNCHPEGRATVPYRPLSSYGVKATMAATLRDMAERSPSVTRQRQYRMTKRRARRLRKLIEDLGRNGLRGEHLERYLSRDPRPEECITLADYLWNAAFRPQDTAIPSARPPLGSSLRRSGA
jgi:hypothetical protein